MAKMLEALTGRSKVLLRVKFSEAARAATAMDLPVKPLQASGHEPWALWLAPDQWMLASDFQSADSLIGLCREALGGLTYSATTASAALTAFRFEHNKAGALLAMGSGLDFDKLTPGTCARTRLARVPVVIVPLRHEVYELYVDRSYARYLHDWMLLSASDPLFRRGATAAKFVGRD